MKLSEHFTLDEFVASETAARRGIDNDLPTALAATARETCEMLERIRSLLSKLAQRDVSIIITSGYRSLALNRAIGSGDGSDHVRAQAADIKAPAFGSPLKVCTALAPHLSTLGIGQLIHEFGSWVHVSTRTPANPVNRIITIDRLGTRAGIHGAR